MKQMKQVIFLAVMALLFVIPASALEVVPDALEQFCFSASDFTSQEDADGIFITAVPSHNIAVVTYCGRIIRAGDALPKDALNQLTLETQCVTQQDSTIEYRTIADGKASSPQSMALSIRPKRNAPPTAEDSTLETYRNIANSGQLRVSDPENGSLTYTILQEPKRGTVEIHSDGNFTYTPAENKVGKDKFIFTVTDDAGNTSEPATVSICIKKPSEKPVYSDMAQDPDAFAAAWLRENGIFTGASIGGHLCFSPEETVSRGEFLVMVMKLVDAEASDQVLTTGFSDEADTPTWLQPYLVSALRNGMISGVSEGDQLVFLSQSPMTQAEAAVMVQNILKLPVDDSAQVFSQEGAGTLPTWAEEAAAALGQAGIALEVTDDSQPLTRRDAARLLYDIHGLMEAEVVSTFYWVQ